MRRTEGSELATTSDLALATFLVLKDLDPEVETDPKTRTVNFGFPPDTRYRDLVNEFHRNPAVPLLDFVGTFGRLRGLALDYKYGHPRPGG